VKHLRAILIIFALLECCHFANAQQFSVGANIGLPKGIAFEVTYHEIDGFTTGWAFRGAFGILDISSFAFGARVDALYRDINETAWIKTRYWGLGIAYTDFGGSTRRYNAISLGGLYGIEGNIFDNTSLFIEIGLGIPIPLYSLTIDTSSNSTVDGKFANGAFQAFGWGAILFFQSIHIALGFRVYI
jgi:hypothetical protein